MRFRLVLTLLLTQCCLHPLHGQVHFGNPKLTDRVAWMEGGGWAYLPIDPGSPATVVLNGRREVIAPLPNGGSSWSLANGRIFVLSARMDGHREHLWFNQRSLVVPGSPWERLAEVDASHGIPRVLFPLKKEDCYLGLDWTEGFVDKERASFAAIFRLRDGRLSLDALVDMPSPFSGLATRRAPFLFPVPEAAAQGGGEPGIRAPRFICEATMPGLHPTLWAPASVGDFVVLASSKAAILWAFSTEDGQCKRVLNLEDLKPEDLPRLGALNHHLLAMQPTGNGTLLMATRSPEVLKAAMEVDRLAGKAASREMISRWTADPLMIRWLELDPATWKVVRDPTYRWPLPETGGTFERLSRFQFIIGKDGRIHGNLQGSWQAVLAGMGLDGKLGDEASKDGGRPAVPAKDGKSLGSPSPVAAPARR